MMKYFAAAVAFTALIGSGSAVLAADSSVTCALTRVYECFPEEGCKGLSIEEMMLPRFVRIDTAAKTITSLDKAAPRNSKVSSVERLEGLTVMHGTELRGWTISMGEESRNLTMSVAGDGEGFIVFGTCTSL
jgi:hypothetical protein